MRTRRALRTFSTLLIVAGALLLVDAALTLAWQEPVSALLARIEQDKLSTRLQTIEGRQLSPLERRALAHLEGEQRKLAFLARRARRDARPGDPLGRIRIPSIGAHFVLVEGTDTASLRTGPGHYSQTPLPGMPGTVAVAGHRTTYLAPFRHIDRLRRGNTIVLEMPYATFTYAVERRQIVPPSAWWVTRRRAYDRLVLSACHPLYSAAKRIVVFARLVRSQPRGAALGPRGRLAPPARANGVVAL